jgi:hypothetical protein
MPGLFLLAAIGAVFAALSYASIRWGVDSREFAPDRFVATALGAR